MTKSVHRQTTPQGPVWCEGFWCNEISSGEHWLNTIAYIERHNLRRRKAAQPYLFILNADESL